MRALSRWTRFGYIITINPWTHGSAPVRGRPSRHAAEIVDTAIGADRRDRRRRARACACSPSGWGREPPTLVPPLQRAGTSCSRQVVDGVVGEALGRGGGAPAASGWRAAARPSRGALYDALARHPRHADAAGGAGAHRAQALAARERAIATLAADGFQAPLAARAYTTLAGYVIGVALAQRAEGGTRPRRRRAPAGGSTARSTATVYPATVGMPRRCWPPPTRARSSAFGLRLLLDGLERERARASGKSRKLYCLLSRCACDSFAGDAQPSASRTTRRPPPMAATAESVLKPDFKAQRKHFIFTDEHEQLRESIRNFAIKELAPHAEEWEETTFPDSVFPRMGELGFLGLDKPEAVRRPGRRLLHEPGARRGDRQRQLAAAWRWGSRCTPTWRCRRSSRSAPRSRSRSGWCRRSRARRSCAWGSPSPTPARTCRASRRGRCATARTTSSTGRRPTSPTATAPT